MTPEMRKRVAAIAVLLVALAAVAVVKLGGGGNYTIHAHFIDAGQLVKGGLVQVAGRPVGVVDDIKLTDDNQADVVLRISDDDVTPLHAGTVARIRAVGLSGVTNRYVDLQPASSGAAISDGGVLPTTDTQPIVDLDTLLNALDKPTREELRGIIKNAAKIYATTAPDANRATHYLNPAVAQTRGLAEELATDTAAVNRLLVTGAGVTKTLAGRRSDITSGISSTATTLRAIASERTSLQDALTRAPATLKQATGTFARARATLVEQRPVLRGLRPAAQPLASLLRTLPGTTDRAVPTLQDLNALLPSLRRAIAGLPAVAKPGLPALKSTASALTAAAPIIAGLRPYAPDIVTGLFQGLGGRVASGYDANGHFARIGLATGGGLGAGLLGVLPPITTGNGYRTGVIARCPGAAASPAPDRSNPYVEDSSVCSTKDNLP